MARRVVHSADAGLFPTEEEVARRLSQDPKAWRAKATVLERDGLPRVHPIMGGRYWPAVVAFWNRQYGLMSGGPVVLDGQENFDALK
jgi:hypothetical protein